MKCINQNDLEERSHQVSIMRHIYEKAAEVIVFLGDGRNHRITGYSKNFQSPPEVVFHNNSFDDEYIAEFSRRWTSNEPPQATSSMDVFSLIAILARGQNTSFHVRATSQQYHLEPVFEGLRMMLMSAWWSRIWVFQEAIVARKLMVRYGNVSCNWEMFAHAATQHRESPSPSLPVSCSKVLTYFSRLVEDIDNRRRVAHASMNAQEVAAEMLALLRATTKRNASDDRDKVYALLGLLPKQKLLTPSYKSSTRDTYIAISSQIIAQGKSLAPLQGDLGRKNRADLPSWVPDWTALVDDHELYRTKYMALYNSCGVHDIHYVASHLDLESYVLKYAHEIDNLPAGEQPAFFATSVWAKYLKDLPERATPKEAIRNPVIRKDLFKLVSGPFHLPAQYIATVDRVLQEPIIELRSNDQLQELCGIYDASRLHQPSKLGMGLGMATSLRAFVFELKFERGEFERLQEADDIAVEEWFLSRLQSRFDAPDPLGLDTVMRVMTRRRCFIETRCNMGQYRIGWAPLDTRAGDEVYILPGGNTPFLLRKVPSLITTAFRMTGECVIEGAMCGQMCQDAKWDTALLPYKSWKVHDMNAWRASRIRNGLHVLMFKLSVLQDPVLMLFVFAYECLKAYTKSTGLRLVSLV